MNSVRIGIVAEDETDGQALKVLARRVALKPISVARRHGKGCTNLRRKLTRWVSELDADGCSAIIVVHDLDRNPENGELNDEAKLRLQLDTLVASWTGRKHVCIPKEELEAWFWADQAVLDAVARRAGKGKASANPHLIARPKEALIKLSTASGAKPRYSTNDNAHLAETLDIDLAASRCASLQELKKFILAL